MDFSDNQLTWSFSVFPADFRPFSDDMPILDIVGTTTDFALKVANHLIGGTYLVAVESDETSELLIMDVVDNAPEPSVSIMIADIRNNVLLIAQARTTVPIPAFMLN